MDDETIRGIILATLYRHRENANGRVPISEQNFSGYAPVARGKIASTARFLADSGLIRWQPLEGGFEIGIGEITAEGINVIENRVAAKIAIHIPVEILGLGAEAKAEAATVQLSGRTSIGVQGTAMPGNVLIQPPFIPNDDSASQVAIDIARRQQANIAAIASQSFGSVPPLPPKSDTQLFLEARLAEQPLEVKEAALHFADAIKEQLALMQAIKPNDDEGLKKYNDFVDYLQKSLTQLDQLTETLNQAVDRGTANSPDKAFIGTAARIVDQLTIGFWEWLEANRANVTGYVVKVGLFVTGYALLRATGMDGILPDSLLAILTASFANTKPSKKD